MAAVDPQVIDLGSGYTVNVYDNNHANILKDGKDIFSGQGGVIDVKSGKITTINIKEAQEALISGSNPQTVAYSVSMPANYPSLTLDNIKNLTPEDITAIKQNVESVAKVITSKTAADYNQAVSNGMSSEAALTVAKKDGGAVLKEFNRIDSDIDQLNKDTTFAMDADGNITLDEAAGTGERYGVKDVVADVVADTTVYAEEDGSLTMDNSAPARKRVNEALVDLDKSVRERTTVGVNSDGTLTRAEGAATTIAVNDGLVQLSGRTDRIDAT
ncbi:hypothetical protein EHJ72_005001, partial [Escherichia coli]|nr:hypothetical protein [Escherichia coli]